LTLINLPIHRKKKITFSSQRRVQLISKTIS